MVRATLARAVERSGVGVHSGEPARARQIPAAFGAGLRLQTSAGRTPVDAHHAQPGAGCTVLVGAAGRISTAEHLLAALSALGLTDATIAIDGSELPILDGSAQGWSEALDEAGSVAGPACRARELPEVRVEAAGGVGIASPGPDRLSVVVDFGAGGPQGTLAVDRTAEAFRREVAWARTFVRAEDVDRLRAAGRGRGASADNTVIWPAGPLRAPDEPVRHKLLDAWGDLALLGPLRGSVRIERGSHALHLALIASIVEAWRA